MGLFDLIRPKWLHSDPAVRLRAVAGITDARTLIRIAREDTDDDVRQAAIEKIDDAEVLARIAMTGPIAGAHRAALAKLEDQAVLARVATSAMDPRVREAAVARVTDQTFLVGLLSPSHPVAIRIVATGALTDQAKLTKIADDDADASVRAAAAAKLTDFSVQHRLALEDRDPQVRLAAASGDEGLLAKLATDDEDPATREAAVGMISSQEALYEIATRSMDVGTDLLGDQFIVRASQDAALARLTDERLLAKIASESSDQRLVRAAVDRIADQDRLHGLLSSDNWYAREAAVKKLSDPLAILELIVGEQDLDVLQAAVDRLGEPTFETALAEDRSAGVLELAQGALRNTAEAETEQAGGKRIITGSMPSAEKIAAHFDRIVAKVRERS